MGALTLRLPDDLHDALREAAYGEGRSLQRSIERRLRESLDLDGIDVNDRPPDKPKPAGDARKPRIGDVPVEDVDAALRFRAERPPDGKSRGRDCMQFVPVGVKCKSCGKVHTPKGGK